MLSIFTLKTAEGARDYYLNAEAVNYYQSDAESTLWLGQGSKQLGLLNKNVEPHMMLDLLRGHLPNGQKLQNFQGEHRPGFDMTFSAPKSVSILVGLGVAPQLIKFHDEAVKFAIKKIESEFAEARVTQKGESTFIKTDNLVIASFRQPTSRANDPALHTHCVTMNMTFVGHEAKSLASDKNRYHGVVEQIQNNAHYGGLIYRQHLANRLKEAGFKLKLTGDGLFEIDGVPDALLSEFSTRRADILALMDEQGWEGAQSASIAAVLTREGKEEYDLEKLQRDWSERTKAIGFDAKEFMAHKGEISPSSLFSSIKAQLAHFFKSNQKNEAPSEQEAAKACVHVAIETLSQKTSVFTERALKFESMKHGLVHDKPVSEKALSDAIEYGKKSAHLYTAFCDETRQTLLTTPWLLSLEAETLARIEQNKGVVSAISTKGKVLDFQKQRSAHLKHPMTASQKEALMSILTSKDRYLAIQGYAGVAKTTMLAEANIFMQAQGFKVRGLTVASSAANEMQAKAKIDSDVFPLVHQELKNAKDGSLSKTIFVVDEASMLSSPQGHELIKHIERTQSRLILIGDKAQLPSVKNGKFFSLSQTYGIKTAIMDEIVRQKNKSALESVQHAARGEVAESINKLEAVKELPTHIERIQWIANHWLSLSDVRRNETLVFAPTHKNRAEITALMRQGLKKEGVLKGEEMKVKTLKAKSLESIQMRFSSYYQTGDVVRFNQDFSSNRIKQGEYWRIGEITSKHRQNNVLPLTNDKGKTRTFPLKNLPQYKTHAAQFERVIEVYRPHMMSLQAGDKVLWGRNFKKDGLRNGERADLESISQDLLTFKTEKGQSITLNKSHPALSHIDYGYVLTNYKVQGKDASFGIGLMESDKRFSATLKNFYVQISRAVHGMTLVTDNKDKLIQSINKNNDEKSSSIDMISSKQLIQHSLAFERQLKINIQSIIDKKINEERQVLQNKISPNLSENNSNFDKQLTYLKDKKIEEKMIKKDEKIKEIEF